jgi:hypothetical protein
MRNSGTSCDLSLLKGMAVVFEKCSRLAGLREDDEYE